MKIWSKNGSWTPLKSLWLRLNFGGYKKLLQGSTKSRSSQSHYSKCFLHIPQEKKLQIQDTSLLFGINTHLNQTEH